jgi:Rnl2 family RNA ligase
VLLLQRKAQKTMEAGPSKPEFKKYDKMGEDSGAVGAGAGCGGIVNGYVVTEKVHGANFCIFATMSMSGGMSLNFAKRTAVIGGVCDAEDFYSCRSSGLLRSLAPKSEAVVCLLQSREATPVAVSIYGELFGGSYPHPDVPRIEGLEPVQVGVWYTPDLQFMAFDVAVESGDGARKFLNFFDAKALCEEADLLFAAPLCKGTLAECLDFEYTFETTIPSRLGLPPLPPGAGGAEQNLAEGVVVRPQAEPASVSRAGGRDAGRGLFKRKIEQFSERRFQNDQWRRGKEGGTGKAPVVGIEELVRWAMQSLVVPQRVDNVLSKIGRFDDTDKSVCSQLLVDLKDDVAEALEVEDPEYAETYRSSAMLQSELDKLCRDVIVRAVHERRRREAASRYLS